jgi:sRNA-binding regulator protein Hfq
MNTLETNRFIEQLEECMGNQRNPVEVFLINGVRLKGMVKHASNSLVIIGCKEKGDSHINTAAIATYVINTPRKKKNTNFNR